MSILKLALESLIEIETLFSPDASMVDPANFIAPRNGFAMSFRDFIPHLMNVLDQLGMSLHARTAFIKYVNLCDGEALTDKITCQQ